MVPGGIVDNEYDSIVIFRCLLGNLVKKDLEHVSIGVWDSKRFENSGLWLYSTYNGLS